MLTISKPLSAAQARTYHAEEFSSARDNYYTKGDRVAGQWHGRLAEQWGLRGEVSEVHFQRLADGHHPLTDEPLVRHQTACQYTNARGERVKAMEHRAGWDATFSAPKSVALTALVGGDERVRETAPSKECVCWLRGRTSRVRTDSGPSGTTAATSCVTARAAGRSASIRARTRAWNM
jgi:hypothetical protein